MEKLLEVQCEVSTVSDDAGLLCFIKSSGSHLAGNFRALHASSC